MTNILYMIETSGPGGAEQMLISMIEALNKEKYKPYVCLLKDGWLNQQLIDRNITTIILPQHGTLDIKWILKCIKYIKDTKINLMHAHEFAMNTYAAIISRLIGTPCVTTVHGKNYCWEKWHRRLLYRFVSRSTQMIAVSSDIKNFLIKTVGVPTRNIHTILNGINIEKYSHDNDKPLKLSDNGNLIDTYPVIGCVGNLYPVKGHIYFIRAAALILKDYPNAAFVIAGRGQLLDELKNEAHNLGIEEHIHFLGFREDIPSLLQSFDIFVLPSLSEGLPLSILEAMAAKTPVISTNVGGIPEVIKEEETGLLVDPKDPEALSQKLHILLSNNQLKQDLITNAFNKVTKLYSTNRMIYSYTKIYENLLKL